MDWTQVLTIVGAILAIVVANWYMFLWSISETNAQIIKIENWILEIHKEMKDFHGKLCAIEERKKMEKE
jgi:hypothetical protein